MGNQQVNLIDNNYFAGLIDSDFGVYITRNMYKGKLNLRPMIKFVNTRFELSEYCSSVLHHNGINHYVSTDRATVHRDSKRVQIGRLSQCIDFIDKWFKFSIVRRPQLELLREFCISRLDYVINFGWKFKNTPYTDRQKKIFDEISLLNLNYNGDDLFRNYTFSWLAGMIDGDGSIYFSTTKRKCVYRKKSGEIKEYVYKKFTPWLKITTESDTAKNNIIELYKKYNVRYYVDTVESKASRKFGKNKKKYYYSILVKEFKPLLFLLGKLDGKLIAKQKQLELMCEYINIKLKDRRNTKQIEDIVCRVRKFNRVY